MPRYAVRGYQRFSVTISSRPQVESRDGESALTANEYYIARPGKDVVRLGLLGRVHRLWIRLSDYAHQINTSFSLQTGRVFTSCKAPF